MRAVIIFVLVGAVLAAPPVRLMPRPSPQSGDQYAHIFAPVRPADQKQPGHANFEVEIHSQQQHLHQPENQLKESHIELELVGSNKNGQEIELELVSHQQPHLEVEVQHKHQVEVHLDDVEIKKSPPQDHHHEVFKPLQHHPESQIVQLELESSPHQSSHHFLKDQSEIPLPPPSNQQVHMSLPALSPQIQPLQMHYGPPQH